MACDNRLLAAACGDNAVAADVVARTLAAATLDTKNNMANCYEKLGRKQECLALRREVHARHMELSGTKYDGTINAANNLAVSLLELGHFEEVKSLMRENIPACRRSLGADHVYMFRAHSVLAEALCRAADATRADLEEAVAIMEDSSLRSRRVLGNTHPEHQVHRHNLDNAKETLAEFTPPAAT